MNTAAVAEIRLIADTAKVKQMLLNLVSNAVKFTPSGGHIEIRTRSAESWVDIAVSDSGIGIAEQDLARLFKEFQQLDAGVGTRQTRTGLWLALTKHFPKMHGGQGRAARHPA